MTPDVTVRDNGLTVVSLTLPRVETVSIGLYAGVGARFETGVPAGISHFLEHMVFKGTAKRSARQLAEDVEDVGGQINAYTGRDVTGYYIRTLKDDAPLAVDVLFDLVSNARLDAAEVEKERDVILQEIGQVEDTPDDLVFDLLQSTAYENQPFGAPILGSRDSIAAIDADALHAFRRKHYGAGNLVLSAAGKLSHTDLLALIDRHAGALWPGGRITPPQASWTAGRTTLTRPGEQAHLAIGYAGYGLDAPEVYALQVMSTILGGGMSSRLFQVLREDRGLAYSVFSDVAAHAGAGMLSLYAGTNPSDAPAALELMAQCCADMSTIDTPRELARAKAQMKAGLAMALESSASLAEQIGRQMLAFGHVKTPDELLARVEAVTLEDVRAVADTCFGSNQAFAQVGPAAG